MGFGEHHNEEFLESLALIGTSDGSYNFVSENEGEKALEERLVALVKSTSNNIGMLCHFVFLCMFVYSTVILERGQICNKAVRKGPLSNPTKNSLALHSL